MRQRNLALSTRSCKGVSLGKVESQYFVGSASSFGHSTMSHSSGCGLVRLQSREAGRRRTAAKREASGVFEPSRQVRLRHAFFFKLRQLLDRDGLMFKITVQTRRLAAMAAPGLCR